MPLCRRARAGLAQGGSGCTALPVRARAPGALERYRGRQRRRESGAAGSVGAAQILGDLDGRPGRGGPGALCSGGIVWGHGGPGLPLRIPLALERQGPTG